MMMEGRGIDEPEWTAFAQAMIAAGQRAIEAAEAQDVMGVFDTGAELYAVCSGCHAVYAAEVLRPNARLEGD
jgi:mono/diheme cytochrome c family protein